MHSWKRKLPSFVDVLGQGPVVFDGATGSVLYERGVYLNKCFDELNLSNPELVGDVHRDYAAVGADVVQTNTYGANRISLARHGLVDKVGAICEAAVRIAREAVGDRAFVAGAIGPTGLLPKDLMRTATRRQVFEAFHEQAQALADAGADLLIFETFGYLGELELAVEAAYGVQVPLVAEASFGDDLVTADGAGPDEVVTRLKALGVHAVGANCVLGPNRLLEVAERMVGQGLPVVMQPNAGYPRSVDGRAIYQSSPETFGVVARRAFKLGVAAVGGCCGTTPDHIRRVVAAARMLGGGRWRSETAEPTPGDTKAPAAPRGETPVPLSERSRFGEKLSRGEWVVSVEVLPPTGLELQKTVESVQRLQAAGVDVVNIPDGPRATVRMSNSAFASLVAQQTTVEPLLHFCGRDRNLLALQGDLLGAHALGVRNLVCITGDPPKIGDYPDASAVFDLDSIGILSLASGLNRGRDPAGKAMGGQTRFVLATGAEPAALDFDREVKRLFEKKEAGAELVMTQPVFDGEVLDRFLDATAALKLPVLVGILPLASLRNAEFLHKNVPGMRVPEAVRQRLASVSEGKAQREMGIDIAAEALRAVRPRVQGVYLMPPFGRVEAALEVLQRAG
ncbi:MAG: bifunctional homocysteine S-methyltransferase/methylenetetrahydrofolate reductase [Myxococcota bacterium]